MARHLVQSVIAKELRSGAPKDEGPKPKKLDPGRMRLYSFYKPSLQAAKYGVQATQTITAIKGDDTESKTISPHNQKPNGPPILQEFEVIAPQFSLDPKLVNSYYPPNGHADEGDILPHIVFNDPHVPWYRPAGLSPWMTKSVDVNSLDEQPQISETAGHNFMPWLALMVFRPEELLVDSTDATKLGLLAQGMQSYHPTKLPNDGAYPMSVGQYLSNITSRSCYEAGYQQGGPTDPSVPLKNTTGQAYNDLEESDEVMAAIFPTKAQLKHVFEGKSSDLAPLKAQRLMAHVRHLNTIGFPDAGVEEEGLFSVIVSSMTGDMEEVAPSTHIVHLVSLEHMDDTLKNPKSSILRNDNSDRIGLVSLFSWVYTCLPSSVSFAQTMTELALNAQPLRPPAQVLERFATSSDNDVKKAMYHRMNAGYTIARWRTATGEETVAFNRGPLAPVITLDVPSSSPAPSASREWPSISMTGKDYQIFDSSVGIMDTTYSGAWSLGRVMAISDSNFNAALMRLRSTLWTEASSAVRMFLNGMDSKHDALTGAVVALRRVTKLSARDIRGPVVRLNIPNDTFVAPPVDSPAFTKVLREAIDLASNHAASAVSKDKVSTYNGFDGISGNNSDWEVVLNWVHDVMFLATIPAHVLFPEPSHLQTWNPNPALEGASRFYPEALRFFHIDHAWIDAYLDGALSVANHLEPEFDYTRLRIKALINAFLKTSFGKTQRRPPVPRYGFVIRSTVVKSTPDLRLAVSAWDVSSDNGKVIVGERDCLVRWTRMDEFTILCLLDCLPQEIKNITMSQPAHQQRFALNCKLHPDKNPQVRQIIPDIKIMQLYTDAAQAPKGTWARFDADALSKFNLPNPDQSGFYDPKTRCIDAKNIAQSVHKLMQTWGADKSWNDKPPYSDTVPNSCIVGLELNDPAYELVIPGPSKDPPTTPIPGSDWIRQIWQGTAPPSRVRPSSRKPQGGDIKHTRRPRLPPPIVPPDEIELGDHADDSQVPAPLETWANGTTVIPRATLDTGKVRVDIRRPFAKSALAQFRLLVHPAYKPPPPYPLRSGDDFGADTFSALDYLPSNTIHLYDIIFAIQRIDTAPTDKVLKSITIEIPVGDPKTKPTGFNRVYEPLLDSSDYSDTGVYMCGNTRFIATLFSGSASSAGSPLHWDGKPILGITLVPRSGRSASGGVPLGKCAEVSVRVVEPRVLDVWNPDTSVKIMNISRPQPRGRSLVRMTERYAGVRGGADEYYASWCLVLKRTGGDKDLLQNDV